ncbi:MAG: ion transporter [Gammaproteobacteria bacterium]|nr:ion transporter [Gammaproteobacteria bacterium]
MLSRRRVYEILEKGDDGDSISVWVDRFFTLLVLLNIAAVIAESVQTLYDHYARLFDRFELFSVVIFSIEYLLRVWSAPERGQLAASGERRRYIFSFHGIVDFFAILPFYLQILLPGADLRVLRVLRLIRVLKLSHYSSAIEDLFEAIRAEKRSFIATLYLLLIAILLASSLMYFAEHDAQPEKFATIPHAMYWAVITLTTVGYGDVSPVTPIGQALSLLTAFMGVCAVAMLTGIVASSFANQMARRRVIYEEELRAAYSDGVLDESEQAILNTLQEKFDLSDEQVAQLTRKVQGEIQRR